jgi:hypothetical protein
LGKICAEIADIFTENSRPKDPAVRKRFGQIEILKKFVQISIIARILCKKLIEVKTLLQSGASGKDLPLLTQYLCGKFVSWQLRSRAYAVFEISGARF